MQKAVIERKNVRQTEFKDLLFTTKFNTPLNATVYNEAINRIVTEVNLVREETEQIEKFSGHTFRHTFATRCIEAGVKPKTLQSYLGHATLQMTMDLYVHNTEKHRQEEMQLLEDEISKIEVSDVLIESSFERKKGKPNKVLKVNFA